MQFRLIFFLTIMLTTIACSHNPCKVPPVSQQRICQDIRRQLIFLNNNDPTLYPFQATAGNWASPTRQALLLRKYREYNCDRVLQECAPCAIASH